MKKPILLVLVLTVSTLVLLELVLQAGALITWAVYSRRGVPTLRACDKEFEDLFVKDGHCNDRGYGVMAKIVAADAIRRIRG